MQVQLITVYLADSLRDELGRMVSVVVAGEGSEVSVHVV